MKTRYILIIIASLSVANCFAQGTEDNFSFEDLLTWVNGGETTAPVLTSCADKSFKMEGIVVFEMNSEGAWNTIGNNVKSINCVDNILVATLTDDSQLKYGGTPHQWEPVVKKVDPNELLCGVNSYKTENKYIYENNNGRWKKIANVQSATMVCSEDRLLSTTVDGDLLEYTGEANKWRTPMSPVQKSIVKCGKTTYQLTGSGILYQKNARVSWFIIKGERGKSIRCLDGQLLKTKDDDSQLLLSKGSWVIRKEEKAKIINCGVNSYKIQNNIISEQIKGVWTKIGTDAKSIECTDDILISTNIDETLKLAYQGEPFTWGTVNAPIEELSVTCNSKMYKLIASGVIYEKDAAGDWIAIDHGALSIFCSENKLMAKWPGDIQSNYLGTPGTWGKDEVVKVDQAKVEINCGKKSYTLEGDVVNEQDTEGNWNVIQEGGVKSIKCIDNKLMLTLTDGTQSEYGGSTTDVPCAGHSYEFDDGAVYQKDIEGNLNAIKEGGVKSITCSAGRFIVTLIDDSKEDYDAALNSWNDVVDCRSPFILDGQGRLYSYTNLFTPEKVWNMVHKNGKSILCSPDNDLILITNDDTHHQWEYSDGWVDLVLCGDHYFKQEYTGDIFVQKSDGSEGWQSMGRGTNMKCSEGKMGVNFGLVRNIFNAETGLFEPISN